MILKVKFDCIEYEREILTNVMTGGVSNVHGVLDFLNHELKQYSNKLDNYNYEAVREKIIAQLSKGCESSCIREQYENNLIELFKDLFLKYVKVKYSNDDYKDIEQSLEITKVESVKDVKEGVVLYWFTCNNASIIF